MGGNGEIGMVVKQKSKLSECEKMIMSILYSAEKDLDLAAITEKSKERFKKDWKLQTVATFMSRLQKKGYISVYRIDRYSHYHPEIEIEEYNQMVLEEVRELLFLGDSDKMADFILEMKSRK